MTTTPSRACPGVVLVTDPAWGDDALVAAVSACVAEVEPGELVVQLRDKTRSELDLAPLARRLRQATLGRALFVVNGSLALALRTGADGLHLPESSWTEDPLAIAHARRALGAPHASGFPHSSGRADTGTSEPWVSVAAHDPAAAARAARAGASAVLVSPVFATPGKAPPCGLAGVRRVRAALDVDRASDAASVSLYALGGITRDAVADCLDAGADGVAVIRAVWGASRLVEGVATACGGLLDEVRRARRTTLPMRALRDLPAEPC
jgi:thiamine-phosphate pyrophosphorylase